MKTSGIIGFIIGAAAGSVATWYIVKKKYEQIAQEEIDSVKEYYKGEYNKETEDVNAEDGPMDEEDEDDTESENDKTFASLAKKATNPGDLLKTLKYNIFDDGNDQEEVEKGERLSSAYVITPEQFASTREYYAKISMSLWSDGVITDDTDYDKTSPYSSEEIERMIGLVNLNRIGEYETDVLYVRNDIMQADYEIISEGVPFSEE